MSKKLYVLFAVVIMAAMVLSACQPAATETPAPVEPTTAVVVPTTAPVEPTAAPVEPTAAPVATEPTVAAVKVCQVTDTGGIDDKSFNATAWRGAEQAKEQYGAEVKYLESQQQTDYEKNINAFIDEKCDLIVTVGFLLGDATKAAAEANPDQKFAIVDFAYDPVLPNVLGLVYATDQAGFLAGYAAAATSKTGKVGTFGGIQIPSVTVFMDGFWYGVQYYNEQKSKNVEVLGWDPATQEGLFVGNFESTDDGRTMGNTLMDEGADVIMPVAGPVGLGTAAAVKERGNAWVVGVDDDWAVKNADFADIVLTSVLKKMDSSVLDATKQVIDGNFEGGVYVGTLENKGVAIAALNAAVPAEVQGELDAIIPEIIAGTIQTAPKAQ